MKKCISVILFLSLACATSVQAQNYAPAGSNDLFTQVQNAEKAPAPATPAPAAPTTMLPADVCSECVIPSRTGPWQQLWLRGGYTLWRIGDGPVSTPLVTTGTGELPGVLGDPNTVILYGGDKIDYGTFQGFSINGGIWLDQDHLNGLGFGLQIFGTRTASAVFSSNGVDGLQLSRPFFDSTQNLPFQNSIVQVSTNDGRAGTFSVTNNAEVGGFDFFYLRNLAYNSQFTLNGLIGYRFFQLKEKLDMVQFSQTIPGSQAQPLLLDNIEVNSLLLRDSFHTKNQINGVEVGLQGEVNYGILFAGGTAKVTFGANQQTLNINGSTTSDDGTTFPGGLLALTPNIGQDRTSQFVIMPELNAYLGVQLSRNVRVQLGYDWLYINNVIRPGSQIDPSINQRYLPSSQFFNDLSGPVVPRLQQVKNDFVATGVSLSIEVQF